MASATHFAFAVDNSAANTDAFDNRLRSLEGSVSALQRKMDEKLDQSLERVVSVESKREEQERIFTDILKKILNTVNTVYERLHTGSSENKGRSSSSVSTSGSRSPQNQQQFLFLQDSMESLSREFKEKLDVLQERLSDSINEVTMMTRMASEKVSYISENMILTEDMQRMGESNPRIVETDMSKVLDEVRDGFRRCTRAVVNAPTMAQALSQAATTSNAMPAYTRPSTPPELSFFVGPKRDDCKMTSTLKVPHNCDQLEKAGANCDGPYIVYDTYGKKPMKVMCDMSGGGWTVILRRGPAVGAQPLSFDRSWSSYKHGFGNILEEFYFGNENIHKLTESARMLRVELESFGGDKMTLDYENFTVAEEGDNYRMRVGRYLGNNTRVGNAFRKHNDKEFSTADKVTGPRHCPVDHRAGHWWHSCYSVLLTGEYATPSTATSKNGIRWSTWKSEPLKSVVLKLREMPQPTP
ncbi:fibroleukin-like [Tropilaelaps mercedesae]|uniref:Fibroleukin-like n=1 Tax=Tropilaelaps mercedesae TaxID=418985 RepID=A0A1V9WZI7_9ACAR|nr:fibroleukin-like [Tropilaelaps mercedesae]